MSWKKSDDGGLDYDVRQETKKEFNPFATAYTSTMNFNFEELPAPLSLKDRIKARLQQKRLDNASIKQS